MMNWLALGVGVLVVAIGGTWVILSKAKVPNWVVPMSAIMVGHTVLGAVGLGILFSIGQATNEHFMGLINIVAACGLTFWVLKARSRASCFGVLIFEIVGFGDYLRAAGEASGSMAVALSMHAVLRACGIGAAIYALVKQPSITSTGFQALPRRTLTIGPFALVLLILGASIMLYTRTVYSDVLTVVIVFLIYLWKLPRQQRQLQQALQNLDLVQLTKDGKVGLFLYLRSFRLGRSTLLRRFVPYLYGDQSWRPFSKAVFFEEDISNAIHPHGLLIAIGDTGDSYGAGKIITSDEKWKDHFHWLASHSRTIFVQPDLTKSVRWEVDQLLSNLSYLRKTVWVMPRSGEDKWSDIRDGLRHDIGVVLPPHQADGSMFRLRPELWRCLGRSKHIHIGPDRCA